MRYYKSFILFSLLALVFVACDTDDLEKDIDALKDRVASVEAQVQRLNDEMNILRVALDGNKTITNYSINGDTYTLTLSNGETLTLTQGEVGDNYPSIDISEDGYWVIAGNKTEWRAKAKDGEDATITPQFKIEANPDANGKKYWWVSYDNGSTWKVLENGLAEGENNNPPLINKVEVKDGYFNVTIGDQVYQIPVVEGLECAINTEGLVDGLWTIAGGVEASFSVKVNLADGDLVRVNAPADWNAKVSEYSAGATDVTITLTPPITPSECTIVVEVTRGVNTASDRIKARTDLGSYWAEYQAGFDIKIGDVVINKYDSPDAVLLQNGETISSNGVYFIAENASIDWTAGGSGIIVLSEKKNNTSSLNVVPADTKNNCLFLGANGNGIGVLLKSIKLKCIEINYSFNVKNEIERFTLDHCIIEMAKDKAFSYFSSGGTINNIWVESCHISVPKSSGSGAINFLNCNKGSYGNVTLHNNIFYCSTPDESLLYLLITAGDGIPVDNVNVERNTVLNLLSNHGSSSGFVKLPIKDNWTVKDNLFWYDTDCLATSGNKGQVTLMSTLPADVSFNKADFENKVFAPENTALQWSYFRTVPEGFTGNAITASTESPFVDGTLVDTEGKYTLKPEYQGIGATIE